MEEAKEVTFKIVRKFGVLSDGTKAWQKELNLVSWNDREAKLDIREWSDDHTKMGKGVTMTRAEAAKLYEYLGVYLKS